MDKFINKQGFKVEIFDNEQEAEQAGEIGDAILATRSLRLTEIAVEMSGKTDACYKRIQRFLKAVDPRVVLWRIYFARMKIDETFRDLKSLLGMTRLMNIQPVYMEKMLALLLLTFTIGLLVGEQIRDFLYGEPLTDGEQIPDKEHIPDAPSLRKGKKWKCYSGLFVILKQKWSFSVEQKDIILSKAFDTFLALVQHPVRTYV